MKKGCFAVRKSRIVPGKFGLGSDEQAKVTSKNKYQQIEKSKNFIPVPRIHEDMFFDFSRNDSSFLRV
jgi:hypothetical protein